MEGEGPSVGIDVSKSFLDVSVYPNGNTWQVEYSPAGMTALAEGLADLGPTVGLLGEVYCVNQVQRTATRIRTVE